MVLTCHISKLFENVTMGRRIWTFSGICAFATSGHVKVNQIKFFGKSNRKAMNIGTGAIKRQIPLLKPKRE